MQIIGRPGKLTIRTIMKYSDSIVIVVIFHRKVILRLEDVRWVSFYRHVVCFAPIRSLVLTLDNNSKRTEVAIFRMPVCKRDSTDKECRALSCHFRWSSGVENSLARISASRNRAWLRISMTLRANEPQSSIELGVKATDWL